MKKGMKSISIQVPVDYKFGGAQAKKIIDACFQRIYDEYGDIFTDQEKEALTW